MIRLDGDKCRRALKLYQGDEAFFPLVAAVLAGLQAGVVYADQSERPSQYFVEHTFGFAQLFGKSNTRLEQDLERYLLEEPGFYAPKVRLYGVHVPEFLKVDHPNLSLSIRQRFHLGHALPIGEDALADLGHSDNVKLSNANDRNITEIEEEFGVVERFWRSPGDFIEGSNASIVIYQGKMAAICYAAATVDRRAEIDVVTLPEYRKLGLGKAAVASFIQSCQRQGIEPLWDCFTNNRPSMSLARSVGFVPYGEPYRFYTMNR